MEPSRGAPGESRARGGRHAAPRSLSRSGTVPFRTDPEPAGPPRASRSGARRDLRPVGVPAEPEPQEEARPPRAAQPPRRSGTVLRSVSGVLVAGFAVLAVFLIAVQIWGNQYGWEGPGAPAVSGHVIAGLAAAVLQAVADRRRDRTGGFALLGALVLVLGSLWFWWWR